MTDAVIVAAARSPIGRARKGRLGQVRPDDLAATVVRAMLDSIAGLPLAEVDDLFLGASQHTGEQSQNLGRRVAVLLGADSLPATTVNRACASSLQTTQMAFHAIRAGEGDAFLSVGVESVSRYRTPPPDTDNPVFAAAQQRTRRRAEAEQPPWSDPRQLGDFPDYYVPMGQTAENVAEMCGVTRAEQDAFALGSQRKYAAAMQRGVFARQIVPITLPDGSTVAEDESPRPGTTMAALAALEPVFRPGGTVTAGNSCPLNDGAAALLVVRDEIARELQAPITARIVATGVSAMSPEIMGLGPIEASERALKRCGMTIGDVDLVEVNEAFAAQVVPVVRALGADEDRVNVHGGAIALGHPFGMTGARLIGGAIHALAERDGERALVTLCVGMGQGMAVILERR